MVSAAGNKLLVRPVGVWTDLFRVIEVMESGEPRPLQPPAPGTRYLLL